MKIRTFVLLLGLLSVSSISPVETERELPPPRVWVTTPLADLSKDDAYVREIREYKTQDDLYVPEPGPDTVVSYYVTVRLSWYDPELCVTHNRLINCGNPDYWWNMGDGRDARDWYDKALACPKGLYGITFLIDGLGYRTCYDGGGQIFVEPDGVIRLDVLTKTPIRTGLRSAVILP